VPAQAAVIAATDMSVIPYVVLATYLLILLGLGWLGFRRSQAAEEDYYLAGRGQGWIVTSFTIMATFFSSFALMGAPGMVYREGIVFALVSLNVPVAGYCVYLLGRRIRAIGAAFGYVTPADMICDYYGSKIVLRLLVVLVGVLFAIPYVMMQLKAGGELAAVLFDQYELAFEVGAVVLALITALYIMIGGMRSVAWTDAMQCVLLCTGMILAGVAMVSTFGGLGPFLAAVAKLPESSLTVPGNTGFWRLPMLFTVCLLMPLGGIIQPAQWMRFYSARDEQTLRRSALIFVIVLTGCFLLGIMLVGLGGQVMYPLNLTDGKVAPNPQVGSYDQVLVVVVRDTLPTLFGPAFGLALASTIIVAIMAAAMSTADSNLHAIGALATRDVYARFVRPEAGQQERIWVSRIVILASTAAALIFVIVGRGERSPLAGFMQMIVDLALFAVAFSVQLLPLTIDMLYVRRGTRFGAIAGLAVGLVGAFAFTGLFTSLVTATHGNVAAMSAEARPPLVVVLDYVNACKAVLPIHASAWGLIPNAILFGLVSLVTPGVPKERRARYQEVMEAD
jgi:SSS family solute:Na+ symporter